MCLKRSFSNMATTHVFIVDSVTFSLHLKYMFAGTGAKDVSIDFNNTTSSNLHHATESNIIGMMADFSRLRSGDFIIFYLQQDKKTNILEGKFYGVFKVKDNHFFLDNNDGNQYLKTYLRKSLTFRILIEPYQVYPEGVTEWEALDEIRNINSPFQMLWSLIYRKLKGNRGNTMITLYESDRLRLLISLKNNRTILNGTDYDFDINTQKIVQSNVSNRYIGRRVEINLLQRLVEKYKNRQQFEAHLQQYILHNFESIPPFQGLNIDWLGNEVSCGVGMQRIDILVSVDEDPKLIIPIELKTTVASVEIIPQLQRYIDWLKQYYLPNIPSIIQPMIITRKTIDKTAVLFNNFVIEMNNCNNKNNCTIKYVEFDIDTNITSIDFTEYIY